MQPDQFYKNILRDVATDLTDAFDQNFERKAFFNRRWKVARINRIGSLMQRTGSLRRSIRKNVGSDSITWSSSEPHAAIHNLGGTITVTQRMKKFFWAKSKELGNTPDAQFYKNMALMKVGSQIKIPQRQFIGDHPEVKRIIKECMDDNLRELDQYLQNQLRQR